MPIGWQIVLGFLFTIICYLFWYFFYAIVFDEEYGEVVWLILLAINVIPAVFIDRIAFMITENVLKNIFFISSISFVAAILIMMVCFAIEEDSWDGTPAVIFGIFAFAGAICLISFLVTNGYNHLFDVVEDRTEVIETTYEIIPNENNDYIFFVSNGIQNEEYYIIFYYEEIDGQNNLEYKKIPVSNIIITSPVEKTSEPTLVEICTKSIHVVNGNEKSQDSYTYAIYLSEPLNYIELVGSASFK